MKDLYLEFKEKREKRVNDFPMRFAFSNEQLEKALEELGATVSEVVSIGQGGIIKKTDIEAFNQMWADFAAERAELMKDKDFIYKMFAYEMRNHEYSYNRDPEDTLAACGLTAQEVEENYKEQWEKAEKEYFDTVDW